MKNSGIKWIGEIPDDWEQTRLKSLFIDRCGGAWGDEAQDNEYDRICIRIADIDFEKQTIKVGDKTIRNYQSKVIDKLTLRENDLLIEKSGGGEKMPVGRTILATECPGVLFANFIDRLRIRTCLNARFIAYLFRALYNNGITLSYIKQTTGIQNLDVENLLSVVVYTPRTEYQQIIADFLDKICAEIDRLIAHEEAMIDELKAYKQSVITEAVTKGLDYSVPMKDSGVDWIGEIPAEWKTSRIKYCATYNDEILSEKTNPDFEIQYVDISAVTFENGVEHIEKYKYKDAPSRARRITKKNDIIVSTVRTYLKAIASIKVDHLIVSTGFCVLRSGENISSKYLEYYCKSNIFTDTVAKNSIGINYPSIGADILVSFHIPNPNVHEQQQIAEHLDRKCDEIDRLISLKHAKIEELRDYKKSLIYEYVTGKKEVV